MGRINPADAWCILRCAGPRTLKVTAWLRAEGFDAWSPVTQAEKRRGPARDRVKVDAPITPTFVFARADRLDDLRHVLSDPRSTHPAFSVFRYHGRVPLITSREVERLRLVERRDVPKPERRTYPVGATVRPSDGAYTGLEGVVKRSDGRYTLIAFGGWMEVKIETFALSPDDVHSSAIAA